MRISVCWLPPLELHDGTPDQLVYDCYPDDLPDGPGVYVFARSISGVVEPLHVGTSLSLRIEVPRLIRENLGLMQVIKTARTGPRILLPAEVTAPEHLSPSRALDLVQRALVDHYVAEGFELVTVTGERLGVDELVFGGHRLGRQTCPRQMTRPSRRHRVPQ